MRVVLFVFLIGPLWGLMLFLATSLVASGPALAQDRVDKVRAVFLFKITGYVTWPNGSSPQAICTYGQDPFQGLLEKINQLQDSAIHIKHLRRRESIKGCDVIYISSTLVKDLKRNAPILTVGDSQGFAEDGGMIEIQKRESRIKLVINLKKVDRAGLKISSKLLDLADVIR